MSNRVTGTAESKPLCGRLSASSWSRRKSRRNCSKRLILGPRAPPEQPSDNGAEELARRNLGSDSCNATQPLSPNSSPLQALYAARDQRTRASVSRSQDRRRLRSSARAEAARRLTGIAARRASTARLSRRSTCGTSYAKRRCQRVAARSDFSGARSASRRVSSSASARPTKPSSEAADRASVTVLSVQSSAEAYVGRTCAGYPSVRISCPRGGRWSAPYRLWSCTSVAHSSCD